MKKLTVLISYLLSALILHSAAQAQAPADTIATQHSIAPMLKHVTPAIVNITVQGETAAASSNDPTSKKNAGSQKFIAIGSGVIIDAKKGYVVTNAHVIYSAKTIIVRLKDGRRLIAKLIGSDTEHDVALLQIPAKNLTALTLDDSNKLNVGDFVAAVGSPYGLTQTVTSGIISALNRSGLGIEQYENFIQTDAPINPGNSGGALIDSNGHLIGINTAIITPDTSDNIGLGNVGIGLAIPSNTVKRIVAQLIKYGEIKRGVLGVQIQTLTPDIAQAMAIPTQKGALVTQVIPYSPAAKAGIEVGDVLISANGEKIINQAQIRNIVGLMLAGEKLTTTLIRHHRQLNLTAVIVNAKAGDAALHAASPFLYGVTASDIAAISPATGPIRGASVLRVKYGSPAYTAGLRVGDLIVSADDQMIKNTSDLVKIAQANKNKSGLLLNVLRGSGSFYLVIEK